MPEEERVRKTVTVSPANYISRDELIKWGQNLLKHTAPVLIIFFVQLQAGVDWRKALPIALYALYGLIIDFLTKYKSESITE